MQLDMSKMTIEERKALAKTMMKIALSRMTPEQRKVFIEQMRKSAYKAEIYRKLDKHKKVLVYLTLPVLPITTLIQIQKALMLKKMYILKALALVEHLKKLTELNSNLSMNMISPEREKDKRKIQEDYAS